MSDEPAGTKLALIAAAGELFAEHGLGGVSTRAIAEKAHANVAAINYHFGSKENLFTEALLHAARAGAGLRAADLLSEQKTGATRQTYANAIYAIVADWFMRHLHDEQPNWRTALLIRTMTEPPRLLEPMVEEIFRPDVQALKAFFRRVKPGMSDRDAQLWANGLVGQFAFYIFARTPILMLMRCERYSPEFLRAAAAHVARSTAAALGLPSPTLA